jgi:polyisoprenyl-phosphate glycosyltransferase
MNKKITIVIPLYNEAGNLEKLLEELDIHTNDLRYEFHYLFVDDGSKDESLTLIKKFSKTNSKIKYLEFSKNFGHQLALKAGLDYSYSDAVISMDADLQHPPNIIPQLIKEWENGFDVVFTIRKEDKKLSFFKRKTSKYFYKIINYLAQIKIEEGAADFRLMDQKVVVEFRKFNEKELFIRGLVSWLGFKQKGIVYEPQTRYSGTSKYTLKKMVNFAIQGITSFSIKPLYLTIYFGAIISFISILFYIFYLIYSFYNDTAISGWASLISTVVFFGGLNLTVLGIIGIYIGKMFMQTKNRPNYIIRTTNIDEI